MSPITSFILRAESGPNPDATLILLWVAGLQLGGEDVVSTAIKRGICGLSEERTTAAIDTLISNGDLILQSVGWRHGYKVAQIDRFADDLATWGKRAYFREQSRKYTQRAKVKRIAK